ncbi:MORN repeat-containing protein [Methylomonas albis]|uniref:MORN motif-containing protein n=1 Tax=Methylomonas albis TaxID=1854563 RepID=A0ABR9D358_9GAMM|nr:hypothetical protein [Methylomonas albis]MBD9357370.1 hypothetical protein [Methylomonas albis]
MLVFTTGLAGCVSSPNPKYENASNVSSLDYFESKSMRIFGNCNIVVNMVNSINAYVDTSVDCSAAGSMGIADAEYCQQKSKREFTTLYPSGVLTIPLFPIFAVANYISKESAEKDADQVFVACMETRGHIINGYGTYTFENGNKYQGDWRYGAFNGKGVFYWKNGGSYEGQWEEGQKSGDGFDIYSDGVTYKGVFNKNMKNGNGVMKWPDGRRFEGLFLDDRPNGLGVFIAASGERYEGYWSNGCFKDGERWAVVSQSEAYCR